MNVFFFKQKTAYEMRISDWSSDVCSSDLQPLAQDRIEFVLRKRLVIVGKIAVQIDIRFVSSRPMRKTPRIERMQRHHIHPRRDVQVAEIGRASRRERVCQYV